MLRVRYSLPHSHSISSPTLPVKKKTLKNLQRKRSNNWPMMSFFDSGREIRIYRVPGGKKLDGIAGYIIA